jgi:hypothetical protein
MKTIPKHTKIYKTLSNCCKHQNKLPGGCQPVFNSQTRELVGFAALQSGEYWETTPTK